MFGFLGSRSAPRSWIPLPGTRSGGDRPRASYLGAEHQFGRDTTIAAIVISPRQNGGSAGVLPDRPITQGDAG